MRRSYGDVHLLITVFVKFNLNVLEAGRGVILLQTSCLLHLILYLCLLQTKRQYIDVNTSVSRRYPDAIYMTMMTLIQVE